MSKEDACLAEFQADYAEQLEEKDEELDRAWSLLADIQGAIRFYWTDIPEHVLDDFRLRISDLFGDWEPEPSGLGGEGGAR